MSKDRDNPEIFFVIGSLQVGGTEMHLSMVARYLVKRGCAVTVYNLSGLGHLGESMQDAGVKIISPPVKSGTGILKFLNPVSLGLSSLKLFLIFLFKRPKIVHFFLPQAYIIGAIMARCAGLPHLVMSRRSLNNYQDRHPLLRRVERRLHPLMQIILGNSISVIKQLHIEEHVPAEELGLIYNGVKLDGHGASPDRAQERKRLGIGPDTKVLVTVANLIPYKGHVDLLDALTEIQEEMPEDWVLLIVGRDDGIGGDLKRRIAGSALEKHVRFLGPRDDVGSLLHISDVAILCSHEEGFSNVILEGMAASRPMIVTDVGGNTEAVQNEITGLVVPAHSPFSLSAAILRLLGDEQLAARMGAAGRKRVEEQFSMEACVSRYEALYNALASNQTLCQLFACERANIKDTELTNLHGVSN